MQKRSAKRTAGFVVIGIFLTLIHAVLFTNVFGFSSWVENYEMRFLDAWFSLRGPVDPPNDIVIIAMDEESYQAMQIPLNQPIPRAVQAKLLRALSKYGVKRVAYDVLFLGGSPDSQADQALADGIGLLPTILGADFETVNDLHGERRMLLRPHELFQQKAAGMGIVGFSEDHGYVRRFFLDVPDFTADLTSLSNAAVEGISNNKQRPGSRDIINIYGPPATIPTASLHQVIDSNVPEITEKLRAESLKDKLVFVGLMLKTGLGADQKDSFLTAFAQSERMFGVEIHANAAGNILRQDWIKRSSIISESIGLSLVCFALIILIATLQPLAGGSVWLASLALWTLIVNISFRNGFFIPGAFLTTVFLPICYLASTVYYYSVTRSSQKRLKKAFEFYLSPEMAEKLSLQPEAVKLGGEKVVATALFTDIAGFTQVSESLEAEEVAHMLNDYFTEVMDVVFANQGTLIKFIGDAVFVLWGAPLKIENHAKKACETALLIEKEVERFNATGKFPPLHTRIGVNTGPMVVGNLGSVKRFDFTAVGDSVNLASRVEGINKFFGTNVIITESTYAELKGAFPTVCLGRIAVVGKKQAVKIFALLDQDLPKEQNQKWARALGFFKDRNWDEARLLLQEFQNVGFFKVAASFYLKQIDILQTETISEDWQGELVFLQK